MDASALTDRSYWDEVWAGAAPPTIDARDPHQARLDRCFSRWLGPGRRFLEVGAGGSPWPAHIARAHGAEAWGIDFSTAGLAAVERAAHSAGVAVRLVAADLFAPDALPEGTFDVVYSGGFLEHFTDAPLVTRRLAALLRPGGVVVTTVPNLRGVNGLLQRLVDPACFRRHVVHEPATLDEAHGAARLVPREAARYVGVLDLGSVNLASTAAWPRPARALLWRSLGALRWSAESIASSLGRTSGGRLLAPAILGVYGKEDGGGGGGG